MPVFAIHCIDKPYSTELRATTRPAHLTFLKESRDNIVAAGALIGEDGQPIGSMLLVDFPDRKAVLNFVAGDPYSKAGLFGSVAVTQWRQASLDD